MIDIVGYDLLIINDERNVFLAHLASFQRIFISFSSWLLPTYLVVIWLLICEAFSISSSILQLLFCYQKSVLHCSSPKCM